MFTSNNLISDQMHFLVKLTLSLMAFNLFVDILLNDNFQLLSNVQVPYVIW